MKISRRFSLVVGFSALLLAGCHDRAMFDCEDTVGSEFLSEDGTMKAAVANVQCGATTADATWILLAKSREKFSRDTDKIAVFEGAVKELQWRGQVLYVNYGTAKPFLKSEKAKGVRVVYTGTQ